MCSVYIQDTITRRKNTASPVITSPVYDTNITYQEDEESLNYGWTLTAVGPPGGQAQFMKIISGDVLFLCFALIKVLLGPCIDLKHTHSFINNYFKPFVNLSSTPYAKDPLMD